MTDFQPPSRDAASRYEPIVLVVVDDASLREALRNLLRSVGLRVEVFASAAAFLESDLPPAAGCLILDVRLPGQSGLDLQAELIREEIPIPVVFITGHADVPMSVRAMKAGAIDLLTKPFRDQDLLDAVTAALDRDRKRRREEEKTSGLQASFESLTPRERLIMSYVTEGRMNKQIAHEIGVSGITVKIHRGNVMRKMAAKSLAELVAALGNQLPERRFVTIVGPGGIGKTTVALAAATTFRGRYRHGVWFVDLAPVAEGSRVPSALASVLRIATKPDDPVASLVSFLKDKEMLLVIDSCEHVVHAAALLCEAAFSNAPGVHILATSANGCAPRANGYSACRRCRTRRPPHI